MGGGVGCGLGLGGDGGLGCGMGSGFGRGVGKPPSLGASVGIAPPLAPANKRTTAATISFMTTSYIGCATCVPG